MDTSHTPDRREADRDAFAPDVSQPAPAEATETQGFDGGEDDFDFWRDVIGDDIVFCGVVYSCDEYKLTGEGVERLTDDEKALRRAVADQEEAEWYAALTPERRAAVDRERAAYRRKVETETDCPF